MWIRFGILAWLLVATGILYGQQASYFAPDEIFYNGKIITVDSAFKIQEAFAVKGDRFSAVGSNQQIQALAGPETRRVDLRGRAVIPGLMDNHNHQYRSVYSLLRGEDMRGVRSLPELLDRIRKAAAKAKPGETVLGGGGWVPEDFPEKRYPTRQELDEVSGGHPLILFQSRLQAYANTAGLKALGISRGTESLGTIAIRQDASGEPTGVLRNVWQVQHLTTAPGNALFEAANRLAPSLSDEQIRQGLLKMQAQQNALGLTSIRELQISPEIMRIYWDLQKEGKLTLRVSMGLEDETLSDPERLEAMLKPWGAGAGFGDHWLRLDGVAELKIDGNAERAFLREPYIGAPKDYYGDLLTTPEKLYQVLSVVNRYGWRPSLCTGGDKALDIILDAYEAVDRVSSIKEKRWVVEHIPQVHPEQMQRLARMNVLVSAQPAPYGGDEATRRILGEERANQSVPMRTMLDHKLLVSGGTDFPVRTSNPFVGIYFFVSRKTREGRVAGQSERISREEALRVASINNAYMTFEENVKGSIEAGKLADFLILSQDIMTVPEAQILSIHPLATYVGGRNVFSSKEGGF